MSESEPDTLQFDDQGLIPAIAQDVRTGEVRMLAYMNREALDETRRTGYAHYWSRSRRSLWKKGETSGHLQRVEEIRADCDKDAVLLLVRQQGVACHTGARNCFFNRWNPGREGWVEVDPLPERNLGSVLGELESVIRRRDEERPEDSYTASLLEGEGKKEGLDRVLEKLGEEMTEVLISAKNGEDSSLREEIGDLLYHLLVLCRIRDIDLEQLASVLNQRRRS